MVKHGKLEDRRYAAASIYCLYEEGVPVHVGRTTQPVELQAEEHRRNGETFNSYSTLQVLDDVSMPRIRDVERRWSNRLGMDFERTPEAAGKLRSAIEVLCVLAAGLLLCF